MEELVMHDVLFLYVSIWFLRVKAKNLGHSIIKSSYA
jgi:hypothetical protein